MTRTALGLTLLLGSRAAASPGAGIPWQPYDETVFPRAAREQRLVLLDVGAVWCHWCHVMEETTYRDPEVVALVREHFVAVQVDQDSRPDLANRYEDYGWPATVIFDAAGTELVKFQGYIPPPRMRALLRGVVEDPTPGPSVLRAPRPEPRPGAELHPALLHELGVLHHERYDPEHGGWGFVKKYLDADSVEYALRLARGCDADAERMARETLDASRGLVDPVWGGIYQYSHGGTWDNPHFEKIMSMQADALRIYSQAYAQWRDPRDIEAARAIASYLRAFLRAPGGGFHPSQDADLVRGEHAADYFALPDGARRARGIPRVDPHVYTRETAWAAHALAVFAASSGEGAALRDAAAAGRFLLAERRLPGGGFRRDARDPAGPYLGDTVAAGRAFLALHGATGERSWLEHAERAASFISRTFTAAGAPGFLTAAPAGAALPPLPQRDENVAVARFGNLLHRYTGKAEHRALADGAVAYLADPDVARRFSTAGVLLLHLEMQEDPLHVTVVGPRSDPRTRALLATAASVPEAHKRVELWDPEEGPPGNQDVELPVLPEPAAFLCFGGSCSPPSRSPSELLRRLAAAAAPRS